MHVIFFIRSRKIEPVPSNSLLVKNRKLIWAFIRISMNVIRINVIIRKNAHMKEKLICKPLISTQCREDVIILRFDSHDLFNISVYISYHVYDTGNILRMLLFESGK